MGFPYKHCLFKTCLPTRQNGVENRDKANWFSTGICHEFSPRESNFGTAKVAAQEREINLFITNHYYTIDLN